ncbi:MAG: hypothetical protein PUC30_11965 [Lachnospiraceae bacterium]|nr:hypothetical protein [Lachnospiraceae bacterium]
MTNSIGNQIRILRKVRGVTTDELFGYKLAYHGIAFSCATATALFK